MIRNAALLSILAACGGGTRPTTIENRAASSDVGGLAVKPGLYPCAFSNAAGAMGPYACTIVGNTVTKTDGMEPWTGTLSAAGTGVRLEGKIGCGKMTAACNAQFSVDLTLDANGTFRGRVVGKPDWWLTGFTLELRNAGMGGDQYGGAPNGQAIE